MEYLLKKIALSGALMCGLTSLSSGATISGNVEIEPFMIPSTFSFVDGNVDFRFAELGASSGSNESTHILIDGLIPVSDGSSIATSSYRAIKIDDGSVQDVGQIILNLPSGATSGSSASSPIVGIVARQGAWSNFSVSEPSGTTVGGSSGELSAESGSVSLLLQKPGGGSLTGSATYQASSETSLALGDFSLTDGTNTYGFFGTELQFDGSRYYGVVESSDSNPGYDSMIFAIYLASVTDFDGDTIPDLSDQSVGNFGVIVGGWKYDPATGWIWGPWETSEYGASLNLGPLYVPSYPWFYCYASQSWIYYLFRSDAVQWFWDSSINTWIYTKDDLNGWVATVEVINNVPTITEWRKFHDG